MVIVVHPPTHQASAWLQEAVLKLALESLQPRLTRGLHAIRRSRRRGSQSVNSVELSYRSVVESSFAKKDMFNKVSEKSKWMMKVLRIPERDLLGKINGRNRL